MAVNEKEIKARKKKHAQVIKKMSALLIGVYAAHQIRISRAKSLSILMALANTNIFQTADALPKVAKINDILKIAFTAGVKSQNGTMTALNKQYAEVLSDTALSFVSKLGETLKADTLQLISDGIANPDMAFNDIRVSVQELLENKTYEATRIVRTETMRASNSAAYIQAQQDGKQFFTVDPRDEACELCQDEYNGVVFTMDQTDMIPPIHPNCACIIEFHDSNEAAQEWADEIAGNGEPTPSGDGAWDGAQYGDGEVTVKVEEDKGGGNDGE